MKTNATRQFDKLGIPYELREYIRGGVTALAGKKNYPVYLDESACAIRSLRC